jgi:NAD(P)-dependent dehydrogenase (short-subunit alcohol dehydrogenase family)
MKLPIDYSPARDLLAGRVILVTGAGQGIGKAVALACARHEATVVLHGRDVAKLEQTYDDIVASGHVQPAIFPLDLANATDTEFDSLAGAMHANLGRLDGIAHCAAHFTPLTPLAYQSLDQWLMHLRVNLAAPFALTRACLPLLKAAPAASVIFTSETHAIEPQAYWGGFSVSKAGLHMLARIWADEDREVRFNVIVPGPVASPQRRQSHPGEVASALPAVDTLSTTYLYLLGADAANVSGTMIT